MLDQLVEQILAKDLEDAFSETCCGRRSQDFKGCAFQYKMDFGKISPESKVAATIVPVLLIHGQIDSNIPVRHSRRIAANNPSVSLWEVANANHCGAISTSPREFERRLTHWFDGRRALNE